jgi:hypothetical protein
VPIVFPTIRLRNYAGRCGFEVPDWMRDTEDRGGFGLRELALEELEGAYPDAEARPYIHLLDGGVSDNLGLANAVASIAVIGDPERAFREMGHEGVRLILVITVNSEAGAERPWDRKDEGASSLDVVSGLSTAQIHKTNRMVMQLTKAGFGEWARQLSRPDAPVRFEFVEVGFSQVADSEERGARSPAPHRDELHAQRREGGPADRRGPADPARVAGVPAGASGPGRSVVALLARSRQSSSRRDSYFARSMIDFMSMPCSSA